MADKNDLYIDGANRMRDELRKREERWDHMCWGEGPEPDEYKPDPDFKWDSEYNRHELAIGDMVFYYWDDVNYDEDIFVYDNHTMKHIDKDNNVSPLFKD